MDGVLAVPAARVGEVVAQALAKVEGEGRVRELIERGERTQDVFARTGIM